MNKVKTVIIIILLIFFAVILISFIYHKIKLANEKKILKPIGKLVEIDGHKMNVFITGSGDKTLVFMSGGGTPSPILDFKSLYSLLSDKYRIVVVEKFGYGFSDIINEKRDIRTILSQTRKVLQKNNITGLYILCPHSMSGIEALYWVQQYPKEIEAIISLDMALPQHYEKLKISNFSLKIMTYARKLGLARLIPSIAESDAIKYGSLTENEKEIARALFHDKMLNATVLNEFKTIKNNCAILLENDMPEVPILFFISNGVGTGLSKNEWRDISKNYASNFKNTKIIELDVPHYLHNYEYEKINKEIRKYIESLNR